jgi:hypothetical protein
MTTDAPKKAIDFWFPFWFPFLLGAFFGIYVTALVVMLVILPIFEHDAMMWGASHLCP